MKPNDFLKAHGLQTARIEVFPADFSPRQFARIFPEGKPSILFMDAGVGEKTMEFIHIARIFRDCDLAAPEIYAAAPDDGLVLMQDFGDRNMGRLLDAGMGDARYFSLRALDVLIQLHQKLDARTELLAGIKTFGIDDFIDRALWFLDHYFPHKMQRPASIDERQSFIGAWRVTLQDIAQMPQSLMHRDFMLDNLMDIPEHKGVLATGIVDLQDAEVGPVYYDLQSIFEVVRRHGGDAMLDEGIAYYHRKMGAKIAISDMQRACYIFAAQRNMKVLGIVARLVGEGRPEKMAFAPRMEKHLTHLLQDDVLKPVRLWMEGVGLHAKNL